MDKNQNIDMDSALLLNETQIKQATFPKEHLVVDPDSLLKDVTGASQSLFGQYMTGE